MRKTSREQGTHDELRYKSRNISAVMGYLGKDWRIYGAKDWLDQSSIYSQQHHTFYRWVLYPVILSFV